MKATNAKSCLLLGLGVLLALPAQALKLETHVLLADDIYQDLKSDGKLDIKVKKAGVWTTQSIAVPTNVKDAILAYPAEFRAGAAAADMMPDLMVAQMSVHPGHDHNPTTGQGNGGWTSDKWLAHALANAYYPNEIAYAYGMYVHGASDAISHTYVNQYAGGVFKLNEHKNEGYVPELRHIELEKYIAKLAPKAVSGNAWSIVSLPDTTGYVAWHEGGRWVRVWCSPYPEEPRVIDPGDLQEFVAASADDSQTVSGTTDTGEALSMSTATADTEADTTEKLLGTEPLLIDGEEVTALAVGDTCYEWVPNDPEFVAGPRADYMMRTFVYDPAYIRAKVTTNGANGATAYPAHMVEYGREKTGGNHLRAIYDLRYSIERALQSPELKAIDDYINNHVVFFWTSTGIMPPGTERSTILNWNNQVLQLGESSLSQARDLNNRIHGFISTSTMQHHSALQSVAREADRAIADVVDALENLRDDRDRLEDVLDELSDLTCHSVFDPVTCDLIDDLEDEARDLRDRIENEALRFVNRRQSLSSQLSSLANQVQNVIMVHRSITNLPIDVATTLTASSNPIRSMLMKWSQAVDTAMFAYSRAWFDSFKSSMDPATSAYAPLEKWWKTDCHLQRLLGDSNELATTRCTLNQHMNAITDELLRSNGLLPGASLSSLSGRISGIGSTTLYQAKEQLRTWFTDYAMNTFAPDLKLFVDAIESPVTDTSLNTRFTSVAGAKYLNIPMMSTRVKAEMRASSSGCNGVTLCFNKAEYPVYFSSVQTSKMSLFGTAQLAELETQAGMQFGSISTRSNILDKTLYSMDGNHAWLGSTAPPWLTNTQTVVWEARKYGSGAMFGDATNRTKFTGAFLKGPLGEGLYKPKSLASIDWALPANLLASFKECYAAPYSYGMNDTRCANEADVLTNPPPGEDDPPVGCYATECP